MEVKRRTIACWKLEKERRRQNVITRHPTPPHPCQRTEKKFRRGHQKTLILRARFSVRWHKYAVESRKMWSCQRGLNHFKLLINSEFEEAIFRGVGWEMLGTYGELSVWCVGGVPQDLAPSAQSLQGSLDSRKKHRTWSVQGRRINFHAEWGIQFLKWFEPSDFNGHVK